jgi:hypothetical protein
MSPWSTANPLLLHRPHAGASTGTPRRSPRWFTTATTTSQEVQAHRRRLQAREHLGRVVVDELADGVHCVGRRRRQAVDRPRDRGRAGLARRPVGHLGDRGEQQPARRTRRASRERTAARSALLTSRAAAALGAAGSGKHAERLPREPPITRMLAAASNNRPSSAASWPSST